MGNSILFNTARSIALAVNYVLQGPYSDKFLTKEGDATLRINAEFFCRVDDTVFCIESDVDLDGDDLDTGSFEASETYYVYACHPLDGTLTPQWRISKNATYPAGGWDGDDSRQIGGFDTDVSAHIDEATLYDLRTVDIDGAATSDHDATHVKDGSDEINGDHLDIDFTPSNYTPSTAPAEASDVDHLAAHLAGIDNAIRAMVYGVSWDESADTYVRTGVLAAEACGASPGNAKLPIQRQMKRCIVDDNGDVVYYLDPDDSRNQAGVQPTVTGTDDAGTASKVSDSGVFAEGAAEYVGKYVHNTTDDTYALITAKDSDDVLSISADIMDIGEEFEICTAVLDGTDGQVMVEIPRYYFKYAYSGTVHTWEISNVLLPGFSVHPAFVRAGVEVPHRYMGAYEGFKDGSNVLSSESGRAPAHTATRANFRTYAAARGTGWSQQDFYLSSAIQLLYLIEYADFDSQTMIGEGNTKYAAWPGSPPSTTGLSNGDGNSTNNASTAGGAATDYMTYRGVENFYGHIWKFVDGININDNVPYACQDPADFADDTATAYTSLGVTLVAANGYQNTLEQISGGFLPASVGASSSTKLCDYYYQAAGWRVCRLGGSADYGLDAGAFDWVAAVDSAYSHSKVGGRLCF